MLDVDGLDTSGERCGNTGLGEDLRVVVLVVADEKRRGSSWLRT